MTHPDLGQLSPQLDKKTLRKVKNTFKCPAKPSASDVRKKTSVILIQHADILVKIINSSGAKPRG
jgi:hypothetical protein